VTKALSITVNTGAFTLWPANPVPAIVEHAGEENPDK
jgi:hypothetical protein